jgi:heme oxygenase (biliverdin-IX-beta and delta-forming)
MCLSLLKETTRPAHQALESRLTAVLENISHDRYKALLARFLGFYQPLEAKIALLSLKDDFPKDFEPRPKSFLLARDLMAVGLPEDLLQALPYCERLPELSSVAQALGALYVFEGAALGGQVIAPLLHSRLGITAQKGCAFFYGDGPVQVSQRWKAFRQVLESRPAQSAAATAQTALRTFETFDRWLFPGTTHSTEAL